MDSAAFFLVFFIDGFVTVRIPQVTWRTDYEPFVVVPRNGLPSYDQRFVGFGWNRVSHVMSLNSAGSALNVPNCFWFEFVVLPDVFIVHQPHLPSNEIAQYRSSASYRKCLKALKGEFVRDLIWEQNRKRTFSISS
ncbi:unnamed protein product [Gongylonema pulchrum]|uniref:Glycosyltransferase family 92 protein n=1 Tax=Gongylonema pulchrum TaxID=637853 RepID=A0A183E7Y3_9BILA|nr:unnamed protein product [Gongylonema pulchrum]